jgi:hypothetical protein
MSKDTYLGGAGGEGEGGEVQGRAEGGGGWSAMRSLKRKSRASLIELEGRWLASARGWGPMERLRTTLLSHSMEPGVWTVLEV